MRSRRHRARFDLRPILLALLVAASQGIGSLPRRPCFVLRTSQLQGDAAVLANIDLLAEAGIVAGGPFAGTGPGSVIWVVEDLLPTVNRDLARRLLVHESPAVRMFMAQHITFTWPEDASFVYPLLRDDTDAPISTSCMDFREPIRSFILTRWCARADVAAIQDVLLRAAGDGDLGGYARDHALDCVAAHRPEDALHVARAWQTERGAPILTAALRLLAEEAATRSGSGAEP